MVGPKTPERKPEHSFDMFTSPESTVSTERHSGTVTDMFLSPDSTVAERSTEDDVRIQHTKKTSTPQVQ